MRRPAFFFNFIDRPAALIIGRRFKKRAAEPGTDGQTDGRKDRQIGGERERERKRVTEREREKREPERRCRSIDQADPRSSWPTSIYRRRRFPSPGAVGGRPPRPRLEKNPLKKKRSTSSSTRLPSTRAR